MTKRSQTGNRIAGSTKRMVGIRYPTREFPIQREIQRLGNELSAFNERMAESGRRSGLSGVAVERRRGDS